MKEKLRGVWGGGVLLSVKLNYKYIQVLCVAKTHWSHFILSGLNYYVLTSKNKYNVLIVFILYCKTLLLLLRWDMGQVRARFGGMGRFKGGLRCKGWVNSVIINVNTEINYRYNYI